jgi:hypothetical protein
MIVELGKSYRDKETKDIYVLRAILNNCELLLRSGEKTQYIGIKIFDLVFEELN